jgi:5'/3'-nucleotidase SurE
MALSELCPRKPDIVIGGINHGDNASVNAHYSGTMGVTLEGCMKYIPSVAFSLCDFRADADFEPLRPYICEITSRVLSEGLPLGVCLNVNFPLVPRYLGVKVCRMAHGTWSNEVTKCHHPRGYDYWWMVGKYQNDEPEAEEETEVKEAPVAGASYAEVDNLDNNLSESNLAYLDKSSSDNVSDNIANTDLKQDIKSVLLYMDQLLENLPEEKIVEFAKSDEFVTYKKLFSELGLS